MDWIEEHLKKKIHVSLIKFKVDKMTIKIKIFKDIILDLSFCTHKQFYIV